MHRLWHGFWWYFLPGNGRFLVFGAPFSTDTMLVNKGLRSIDHVLFIILIFRQLKEDLFPDATLAPSVKTAIDAVPGSIPFR